MRTYQRYSSSRTAKKEPETVATRDFASLRLTFRLATTNEKGENVLKADPAREPKEYENPLDGIRAFAKAWVEQQQSIVRTGSSPSRVFLSLDNPSTLDPTQMEQYEKIAKALVLPGAPNGFEWAPTTLRVGRGDDGDFLDRLELRPGHLAVEELGDDAIEATERMIAELTAGRTPSR